MSCWSCLLQYDSSSTTRYPSPWSLFIFCWVAKGTLIKRSATPHLARGPQGIQFGSMPHAVPSYHSPTRKPHPWKLLWRNTQKEHSLKGTLVKKEYSSKGTLIIKRNTHIKKEMEPCSPFKGLGSHFLFEAVRTAPLIIKRNTQIKKEHSY